MTENSSTALVELFHKYFLCPSYCFFIFSPCCSSVTMDLKSLSVLACSQSSSGLCVVPAAKQCLSMHLKSTIKERSALIHRRRQCVRVSLAVYSPQERPAWSWAVSRRKPYCSGSLAGTHWQPEINTNINITCNSDIRSCLNMFFIWNLMKRTCII